MPNARRLQIIPRICLYCGAEYQTLSSNCGGQKCVYAQARERVRGISRSFAALHKNVLCSKCNLEIGVRAKRSPIKNYCDACNLVHRLVLIENAEKRRLKKQKEKELERRAIELVEARMAERLKDSPPVDL
jgi:hypothetical protein